MGVISLDVDGDGRMDIIKTNFIDEHLLFTRIWAICSLPRRPFQAGLAVNAKAVGWGVVAVDFDHEGRPDLAMANGHIYPELGAAYPQAKSLYWNGGGVFAAVTGAGLDVPRVSRGMAAGDLDSDGVLELVVSNMNGMPSVYQNRTARRGAVIVRLEGTKSNRSAIGARVVVKSGSARQMQEVQSGGSYASQSDFALHFGVGTADRVESMQVMWPSGLKEEFRDVAANRILHTREGSGLVRQTAWRR
jgi:hypothetical protein